MVDITILHPRKAQSIIEVLMAVAVGAAFVIGGIGLIAPALQTGKSIGTIQEVSAASKQLVDNIRVWSEGDWHNVFNLATGTTNTYYLNTAQSPFAAVPGVETVAVTPTQSITRYFYLTDAYRDALQNATTSATGTSYDPSTKLVTIVVIPPGQAVASPLSFGSTAWATTTPFPTSPNNSSNGWAALVTTNGCIYAVGGYPGAGFAPTTTVYYATVTGSGAVGPWGTTTPVPPSGNPGNPTDGFDGTNDVIANNGYVYLMSGGDSSDATTTLYFAKVNANCTLGTWNTTTPLPVLMNGGTLFILNNYVYVVGGYNNNSSLYAPINPADGTVGAWTTGVAAPRSPGGTVWSPGAIYNNFFYIPGGLNDQGAATSSVYYTSANASGTLAAWKQTTSAPVALWGTAVAMNGYLYVLGGESGTHRGVYYAPLNADGTVGAWAAGADLPGSSNYYPFEFVQVGNSVVSIKPNSTTVKSLVSQPPSGGTQYTLYITRNANRGFTQSDWSGGGGDNTAHTTVTNTFNQASNTIITDQIGSLSLFQPGPLPIQFVQGTSTAAGVTSTVQLSFASNVARHDTVIVTIAYSGWASPQPFGVLTDSAGGAFSLVARATTTAGGILEVYKATDMPGPGGETITYKTVGASTISMNIMDVFNGGSGGSVMTYKGASSASGSSTAPNSGTITGAVASDFLFGAETHDNAASSTAGAGFTLSSIVSDDPSIGQPLASEYRTGLSGSVSSTFTLSPSDTWAQVGVLFANPGSPVTIQQKSTVFDAVANNFVKSVSASFLTNVGKYDLIVAVPAMSGGGPSSTPITDTMGNTFTQVGSTLTSGGAGGETDLYYAQAIATGTDVVTFNNSTSSYMTLELGDFANVDRANPLDRFGELTDGGTSSTASSIPLTTSHQNELLIGAGTYTATAFMRAGNGFAFSTTPFEDIQADGLEYDVLGGSGGGQHVTPSFTYTNPTNWTLHGALFNQQVSLASGTLESPIFNTGISSGGQFNSIGWNGSQPNGTSVNFQLAVSTSSGGPWHYQGPDGTANTWYSPAVNTMTPLDYSLFNNFQYFRYKVMLAPDPATLAFSPRVDDVVLNWSP